MTIPDVNNLTLFSSQGSGRTKVFSGIMNGTPVIVKVQVDVKERWESAGEVYKLGLPYVVKMLAIGKNADGYCYTVVEKLDRLPNKLSLALVKEIASKTLALLWELYKRDRYWTMRLEHILLDKDGCVKLIDFNDDPYEKIPFFGSGEAVITDGECGLDGTYLDGRRTPYSSWMAIIKYLCVNNDIDAQRLIDDVIYDFIAREYQSLENVHQPVYFPPYETLMRRETERNDPMFGKLVKPNRLCTDRAKIMSDALLNCSGATYCDLGSNVGWFPFYFSDKRQMKSFGVDANADAIRFATLMSELKTDGRVTFDTANISPEYVRSLPHYDVVSALSVLHWLITTPPAGSVQIASQHDMAYLSELIRGIGSITDRVFFVELPEWCFPKLGVSDVSGLCKYVQNTGGFSAYHILSKSDAKRNILMFTK